MFVMWKQVIFQLNNTHEKFSFLQQEEKKLLDRLQVAYSGRLSSAVFIIGVNDRMEFTESVLNKDSHLKSCVKGKIDGVQCQNDNHAMLQLANSFLLREYSDKNPNLVLEDLETFFQQRKTEGDPAILIIDNVDEFAKKEKQVIIYTLLDLMHRSDMFFILICMTSCFHLHALLEKRVRSRLNAQYIYLRSPTTIEICHQLSRTMQYCNENIPITSRSRVEEYNNSVITLFGEYNKPLNLEDSILPSTYLHDDDNNNNHDDDNNQADVNPSTPKKGKLYGLIECLVNWGYPASWFLRAASLVLRKRNTFNKHNDTNLEYLLPLTIHEFESVFASQQKPTVGEIVSGLSHVELHVLIAACRVNYTPNRPQTIAELVTEFDKLTSLLRRHDITQELVYLALNQLSELGIMWLTNGGTALNDRYISPQDISESTSFVIIPQPFNIQNAFRLRSNSGSNVTVTNNMMNNDLNGDIKLNPDVYVMRSMTKRKRNMEGKNDNDNDENLNYTEDSFYIRQQPHIKIPERVRRAVLDPLVPFITTNIENS